MPRRKNKPSNISTKKPKCPKHKKMTKFFLNAPVDYKSHYFDSGSFSLWTAAYRYAQETGCSQWDYYDLPEFWEYINAYGEFVVKHRPFIDLFSNVDAIPNPKITFRNQKYLEKTFKIDPVPVVHFRTDLEWLDRYIRRGHEIIGIGGLVGNFTSPECTHWLDRVFNHICPPPKRIPIVKLHGFGVSNIKHMFRYPWWSADSTTWMTMAKYGEIFVPHKRGGKFVFGIPGYKIPVANESPRKKDRLRHIDNLPPLAKAQVLEWLSIVDVPLGETIDGKITQYGCINYHPYRCIVNLEYFERTREAMKPWPWKFEVKHDLEGFGL